MARNWLMMIGLVACALVGCGPSNYGPVDGAVTLNGQPLPGARVMLHPTTNVPAANAMCDASGAFKCEDLSAVADGEYVVTVSCPLQANGQPIPADVKPSEVVSREFVPTAYLDPQTSPLKFTLSRETRSFPINLQGQ